ncbi:hypothetical protein MML63_16645 [Kosakonia sacchari]|uniref:hypothetical protein n=1 Tax=Kosakonia sacchari TaxID=1158459 RepID=UPI0025B21C36|nr:hypothetical protein [Kosakonia sacchari]MDN2487261.1 hypothetical protein [Kosakonia sacchari]
MMRVARIVVLFFSLFLFTVSVFSYGETLNISQEYSSVTGNIFINTTPQSGFCTEYPQYCTDNDAVSVALTLYAPLMQDKLMANSPPRESMFYKMPGNWRTVKLFNTAGQSTELAFRVAGFAASYLTHSEWSVPDHVNNWQGGSFEYAPSPCITSGVAPAWSQWGFKFMWKWPVSDVPCYKLPTIDLKDDPYNIRYLSFIYELTNASPLQLASGDYTGTLHFTVGPGGDVDFGDLFIPTDPNIDINFRLTIKHDFSITTTADDHQVALQPCKPNKICTPQEGEANWERWMISHITPPLTGRSNFGITSTGNFTVYLACANGQIGQDCALQSDNTGQLVPFGAFINLPVNIVDSTTGATVVKQHLNAGKDPTQNIFTTQSSGSNQKGSIDFLVAQHDVETMLTTRPDTWRGGVTVIFDLDIS